MGSFFKFVAVVGILSLLLTTVDQITRSPATGFLDEWMKGLLFVGVVTFFVMAFVLSIVEPKKVRKSNTDGDYSSKQRR
jgi:hypothetical protein